MSTTQVNDFDISMAMDTPMANSASVVPTAPEAAPETSVVVGTPMPAGRDASTITVYANSINPASYGGEANGVAAFDVVFSVGVTCEDGSCKTYQVVKRIGIDKCKIASEAESSTPVSIVEAEKVEEPVQSKPVISEAKRMRILAGLE